MNRRNFLGVAIGVTAAFSCHPVLSFTEEAPYKVDVTMLAKQGENLLHYVFRQVPFAQDPLLKKIWRIPDCKMEAEQDLVVTDLYAEVPLRIWIPFDINVKTVPFPLGLHSSYPFFILRGNTVTFQNIHMSVDLP